MRKFVVLLFLFILSGCVTTGSSNTSSIGGFIFAGPQSADTDTVSVAWAYGFQFTTASPSYDQVKLSCDPIPGSTFIIDGADIVLNDNRVAFWKGRGGPQNSDRVLRWIATH